MPWGEREKKLRLRVPSIFGEQPEKQKASSPPPKNKLTSFVESKIELD